MSYKFDKPLKRITVRHDTKVVRPRIGSEWFVVTTGKAKKGDLSWGRACLGNKSGFDTINKSNLGIPVDVLICVLRKKKATETGITVSLNDFVDECCSPSRPWIQKHAHYGIRRMVKMLWKNNKRLTGFMPITNFSTVTSILERKDTASKSMKELHKEVDVIFEDAIWNRTELKSISGLAKVLNLLDKYHVVDAFVK